MLMLDACSVGFLRCLLEAFQHCGHDEKFPIRHAHVVCANSSSDFVGALVGIVGHEAVAQLRLITA